MRSLWIARYGLLASVLAWATAIALPLFRMDFGNPELPFGLAIFGSVGMALCAVLCVVLQFVMLPKLRR